MSIEIRATGKDELRAAANTVSAALFFPPANDEEWNDRQESWLESDTITAWDGGRCVGSVAAFRFDTTVPGGARLPTAGVTRVGVLPTHTRRRLLTQMMTQLLSEGRAKGQVLASLRASEAVIYQRFGFGVAGEAAAIQVKSRSTGPVREPAPGTVRLLAKDEILEVVPDLYDRRLGWRTGCVTRPPHMWNRYLGDALKGTKPSFVAVHADPSGEPDGFAHYDLAWQQAGPGQDDFGGGYIHDLFGADPAVERALWAFLLDIDLITEWKADERPIDEAIRFAIRDTRAYQVRQRWDEEWLRLLDVDAALAARTYRSCDGAVNIAVVDAMFSDNNGTWHIDAKGSEPSDLEPDLVVDVEVLGAAYLGGTSWRELADAGRVEVRRASAIEDADTLFFERPAPFCGSFF